MLQTNLKSSCSFEKNGGFLEQFFEDFSTAIMLKGISDEELGMI